MDLTTIVLIGILLILALMVVMWLSAPHNGRYQLTKDGGSYTLLDTQTGVARIFVARGDSDSGYFTEFAAEINYKRKK